MDRQAEQIRGDVDALFGFAVAALIAFKCERPELMLCARDDELGVSLRYALTFLISNNLITVVPQEQRRAWLSADVAGPHMVDVLTLLEQAVERAQER